MVYVGIGRLIIPDMDQAEPYPKQVSLTYDGNGG